VARTLFQLRTTKVTKRSLKLLRARSDNWASFSSRIIYLCGNQASKFLWDKYIPMEVIYTHLWDKYIPVKVTYTHNNLAYYFHITASQKVVHAFDALTLYVTGRMTTLCRPDVGQSLCSVHYNKKVNIRPRPCHWCPTISATDEYKAKCMLDHGLEWDKWALYEWTPMVSHVANTVIHLVTLECTHGIINLLYHCRHNAGDR